MIFKKGKFVDFILKICDGKMIYREFIEYYKQQEERPKNTTEFIRRYQQLNSGKGTYLHNAIVEGKMIYKCEGEPNQKWHLLNSWYPNKKEKISEKNVTEWCGLQCPELLLWIAEVSGQKEKVKYVVEKILNDDSYKANDGKARREMVKFIKAEIKWKEILNFIEGIE